VRPLFLTSGEDPGGWAAPVEIVRTGEVTIPWILDELASRGVRTLLIEAGGDLVFQFLAADAVDELYVTVCPLILGGRLSPTLADGVGFSPATARRLSLAHAHRVGDELYCRYVVNRGAAR
jgi:riboflavin biosynthesis pyrimidine reductase